MARRLNMAVFMLIIVSALLKTTKAQTTHVVGGAFGWQIPPGGSVAYATWAATQTFTVGDSLLFNFTTGIHDVAEVTMASFNSCNSTGPISMSTTGPTTIRLNSTGQHYYICTFGSHCSLGQRLSINVSATSTSPAPQPATPTPAPAPQPATPTAAPAPTPSSTANPPSSPATPPSGPAPAPSSTATPPTGSATPPSSPAPSSIPTPPSGSTAPPSTSTAPSIPTGTSPPAPPGNSAPTFAAAALPVTVLSMALAFFYY